MSDRLEGRAQEILAAANPAVLSIPRKDGTVQSVVIWVHAQDGEVTVNSAEGRAWVANLRRAKTATVTAIHESNAAEYVTVTASLASEVGDPQATEHINMLAMKYMGITADTIMAEGERRILFRLKPERVLHVDVSGDGDQQSPGG